MRTHQATPEQLSLLAAANGNQEAHTAAGAPPAAAPSPSLRDTLQRLALCVLDTIDGGGAGGASSDAIANALAGLGPARGLSGDFVRLALARGFLRKDSGCYRITDSGQAFRAELAARAKQPAPDIVCPLEWIPSFSHWRHGGWYVSNVSYPNRACGCVSRHYPDRRWRVVCDARRNELGEEGDATSKSRDAAARGEYALAATMIAAWGRAG